MSNSFISIPLGNGFVTVSYSINGILRSMSGSLVFQGVLTTCPTIPREWIGRLSWLVILTNSKKRLVAYSDHLVLLHTLFLSCLLSRGYVPASVQRIACAGNDANL